MPNMVRKRTSLDLSFQFVLSVLVMIGVFLLTYLDKLQGQAATTLIGMIVGYLFGKERR